MISRRGFLRVIGVTSLTMPMGKLWIPERTKIYGEAHVGGIVRGLGGLIKPRGYEMFQVDYGNGMVTYEIKKFGNWGPPVPLMSK